MLQDTVSQPYIDEHDLLKLNLLFDYILQKLISCKVGLVKQGHFRLDLLG